MIKRNIDFPKWLQKQLDIREWRPTDLARKANVSDAAVSRVLKSERQADLETLMGFASALGISPMHILMEAFDFPKSEKDNDSVNLEDWKLLISQMTPVENENLRRVAQVTIETRQKAEQAARTQKFQIGKTKG
jgi:transcriptional regulator with XRE-family HTH domain